MNFDSIILLLQQSPYGALLGGVVFIIVLLSVKKTLDVITRSSQKNLPRTSEPLQKRDPISEEDLTASVSPVAQKIEEKEETPASLNLALGKSRDSFWGRIRSVFSGQAVLTDSELEQIEEVLYTSDLGPQTVQLLMQEVQTLAKQQKLSGSDSVRELLKQQMLQIFSKVEPSHAADQALFMSRVPMKKPLTVWMMVGVNGAGKTTTIGKLATLLAEDGKKILLAAGDTFRAAAGEQLRVWTERAQVEIFSPAEVKDPSAVAYDAVQKALTQGFDVVIIDTAGRLHTQKNLMEELKKMKRVIQKVLPDAPHETLLVLDANQGQNALIQAKEYHSALDITGVVLTKLDGTAKGGVALGVAHDLGLPIRLIGVGEKPRDLQPFEAQSYVNSLLGLDI